MSLVNDMLRDLDARRDHGSLNAALGGLNPAPIRNSRPAYAHWVMVPLIGVITGIAIWLWLTSNHQEPEIIITPVKQTHPVEKPVQHDTVITVTPEQIPTPSTVETNTVPVKQIESAIDEQPVTVSTPVTESILKVESKAKITKKIHTLTPVERASQLTSKALAAFNRGDARHAESLLQEALSYSPENIQAREQLAQILMLQQRQDEAESILLDGLRHDPSQAQLALLLGQHLASQGRAMEAIDNMEPALINAANDPQFIGTLAGIYQNAGRPELAIKYYQAALSLRPQQGLWWMGLGISLEQTGQQIQAASAYKAALETARLQPSLVNYINGRLAVLKTIRE